MPNVPLFVPSEKIIKAHVRRLVFGQRPQCPRCQRRSTIRRSEHRYRCRACRRPFSLTSTSWLSGIRLSWPQLWLLLWCFGRRYQPRQAAEITRASLPTVRRYYRIFRQRLPTRARQLDFLVAADEAYVGKRKTGNQRIVAGAREVTSHEVRLQIVPNTEQASLEGFLYRNVHHDALVRTDAHKSYEDIAWMGYDHEAEVH